MPSDFQGTEFLRTRRLRLRGLRYADMFDLQRLGRDSRASAALLDAPVDSLAAACALVEKANRIYAERPGLGFWRAEGADGRFLGFFSLVAELDPDEVEIGARLLPMAWGRGYGLEGGAALCTHAFAALALPCLVALCHPANRAVPSLLARLGFVRQADTLQFGRSALRFVLRREDWRGVLPRNVVARE